MTNTHRYFIVFFQSMKFRAPNSCLFIRYRWCKSSDIRGGQRGEIKSVDCGARVSIRPTYISYAGNMHAAYNNVPSTSPCGLHCV